MVPDGPRCDTVIALRFLTGMALACVYPPRMKIAAGWFRDRRGFALAFGFADVVTVGIGYALTDRF